MIGCIYGPFYLESLFVLYLPASENCLEEGGNKRPYDIIEPCHEQLPVGDYNLILYQHYQL
jgi:hypothetical protein